MSTEKRKFYVKEDKIVALQENVREKIRLKLETKMLKRETKHLVSKEVLQLAWLAFDRPDKEMNLTMAVEGFEILCKVVPNSHQTINWATSTSVMHVACEPSQL